jgi:hypothetical protein
MPFAISFAQNSINFIEVGYILFFDALKHGGSFLKKTVHFSPLFRGDAPLRCYLVLQQIRVQVPFENKGIIDGIPHKGLDKGESITH